MDEVELEWMREVTAAPTRRRPSGHGVGVDAARQICAECPVKADCLEYVLESRIDHGVWGGSERERRRILRRRRLEAAATA